MKKVIIVALIIAIGIIAGVICYYSFVKEDSVEQGDFVESQSDTIEDITEDEIAFEDVGEEEMSLFQTLVKRVFVDWQANEPLPEFENIKNLNSNFLTLVAFNGACNGKISTNKKNEYGIDVYSYDQIDSYIVSLLGEDAHNLFDNDTYAGDFFDTNGDGYSILGMGGSETLGYSYFIDSLKKGSDGKYYGYIYEYAINTPNGPILDKDQSGSIERVINTKQSSNEIEEGKLKKENIIKEYIIEVIEEGNIMRNVLKDGNREIDDSLAEYEKVAKENKDKLVKKELVLEYDEDLDCFYLNAIRIVD